ncbi:FAD-dependent monooxygenase [Streptomyces sp. NPDC048290]|uniref:NAD(P)/FAD-dependent oxidoreductase n=1 Tax=Streptomyces sp. NPDC048290 TaxID=3155811 RepID=UPI00343B69CF
MRDPHSTPTPTHAIVIGASIAGMLAAAALRDHIRTVEIIEAHDLPEGPAPRTGVPQAAHIHFLQTGGADAVERLLPGTTGLLLAAGAHRIPVTTNMVVYSPHGWYRRWNRTTHQVFTASRDLTDSVIRAQVLKDPRVTVRTRTRAVALLGDARRVTGVRVRAADGTERALCADLVVDASGRATRTPGWLARLGITGLVQDEIDSGLAYASRFYRAPVPTEGWPVVAVQADPGLPGPARSGHILPVEADRWHVSLMGGPGGHPTADPDAFEDYARTLRHPLVADLLRHAEPLSGVSVTHTTTNRRSYYERLPAWPDGLVALGDSVAAFNPVYGQGMSSAARAAVALREQLAAGGLVPGLARRAQRAVGTRVTDAWSLAVGSDIHFAGTRGRRPTAADRLLRRYVGRLSHTATGSFHAATALTDVLSLRARPVSLVKPGVLLTALAGPLRPPLDGPPFTTAERRLLSGLEGRAGGGCR